MSYMNSINIKSAEASGLGGLNRVKDSQLLWYLSGGRGKLFSIICTISSRSPLAIRLSLQNASKISKKYNTVFVSSFLFLFALLKNENKSSTHRLPTVAEVRRTAAKYLSSVLVFVGTPGVP